MHRQHERNHPVPHPAGLTDGKMREGLVDGQDVARGIVRELFRRLQVIVRDHVIARIDTLPAKQHVSSTPTVHTAASRTHRPLVVLHRVVDPPVLLAVRRRELA